MCLQLESRNVRKRSNLIRFPIIFTVTEKKVAIIQLLTIEALDMIDIDLRVLIFTKAEPRSILVFSGRYHIMSNASIVNNCFII